MPSSTAGSPTSWVPARGRRNGRLRVPRARPRVTRHGSELPLDCYNAPSKSASSSPSGRRCALAKRTNREVQMTDKIRVGIVGATVTQGGSGWGDNAHVPALKALPDYQLKAVCTSHEDTAKASAAAFGAERGFHRFRDMAAHPEVDLIVVCVRVPGHRELVMAGLQAGKPVLCEWPLGKNLAEAKEMAGLASQRSVKTIVGLQARSGAEVSINVAAVPSNPGGNRIEIYGREGTLVLRADGSFNTGGSEVHGGRGKEPMASMPVPSKYRVVPERTPAGQPYNVAQAYARAADALRGRGSFDVDFNLAVQRHKLIDAIERSAATGRSVKVE